jgi:cleavage and polyadenylation specificity factor subunit 2
MERQRVLNDQKAAETQAEKKKLRKTSRNSDDEGMDVDADVDEEEEEEEDDDEENQVNNKSKSSTTDAVIDTGLADDITPNPLHTPTSSRLPSQSPFAPKRKAFGMFPYKEEKYVCDDYGEIINPDDYMIVETKAAIPNDLSSMNFGDSDERHPLSEIFDGTNNTPSNLMMMIQQQQQQLPPIVLPNNQSQHPLIQQVQHQPSAIPFKTLREKRQLKINAKVLYVDFEARSDRESIEKLLNQIKPKNLILIHGTQDCIEQLEKYCTTRQIVQGRIFAPHVGEIVDATTERNLYQVRYRE